MPDRLLKPSIAMVGGPLPIHGSATAVMLQLKNMSLGFIQPKNQSNPFLAVQAAIAPKEFLEPLDLLLLVPQITGFIAGKLAFFNTLPDLILLPDLALLEFAGHRLTAED
jgi:hypothetical protein